MDNFLEVKFGNSREVLTFSFFSRVQWCIFCDVLPCPRWGHRPLTGRIFFYCLLLRLDTHVREKQLYCRKKYRRQSWVNEGDVT